VRLTRGAIAANVPRMSPRAALPLLFAMLLLVGSSARVAAQSTADDSCTYRRCALAVVPAWNGLDLVRGERGERVGRLGFLWTRDVSPIFAGDPRALGFAKRAVRTRRTAAFFTDVGGALLLMALAGGLADRAHSDRWQAIAIGGGATFAVSVPLQFAADGHLSRAVWWLDARFAR